MQNENLKIEYIELDKLTPYPNNSKIHTAEQIKHIANSITEFGFNDPLAVAGENNVVLEGNGRIEAAKLLGMTRLPCIRLDRLSETERRAYVIAHNALNLETGFDDAVLFAELEKLQKDYDMAMLGVETEKYIQTLKELERKTIVPYRKAHYLITLDINLNDKVVGLIEQLRKIEGVEVDATVN